MSYSEWAKVSEEELEGLNLVWTFLTRHGLLGVPDVERSQKTLRTFDLARSGYGVISTPSLPSALVIVEQFYAAAFESKLQVDGIWNYLGNEKNRLKYSQYLRSIYWQNQTNEDLVHASNSHQYLESPELILANREFMNNIQLYSPLDMLDTKGLQLVENLTTRLSKLIYSPLFVPSSTASIVCKFLFENTLQVTLLVAKSTEFGLAVQIEYELGFNEYSEEIRA